MQRLKRIILSLLVIFIFTSCAIKDYVPNDKLVLIDNQIDIDTTYSEINKSDISNYIIQKPSSSLFNWQPRVWIYYKTINNYVDSVTLQDLVDEAAAMSADNYSI